MQTKLPVGLAVLMLSFAPQVHGETAATPDRVNTRNESPVRANAPNGAVLGSRAEEDRYAAREASSPDAKQYRGGDVIVISATAVAVILLVVLILILL